MTNFNSDSGFSQVLASLSEIRSTQLTQAEDLGYIKASVEGLAGPQGRVTNLERTNTRQWWLIIAITPALLTLHGIARKLGVNV